MLVPSTLVDGSVEKDRSAMDAGRAVEVLRKAA